MKPFECFGRCQDKNIQQQLGLGVRYFDLRIAFDNEGVPYFCHGLLKYELDFFWNVGDTIGYLNSQSQIAKEKIYVRVLLESFRSSEDKDRKMFNEWSEKTKNKYKHLSFRFGYKNPPTVWGGTKWPELIEVAKHFDKKWHILFTPKYWAKRKQGFDIIRLESQNYQGICSQDFV
jgi:hypothetical protein